MSPPPTTARDAAKLFDINVDQLAGAVGFVATRPGPGHRRTGDLIDALQLGHPVPGQDPARQSSAARAGGSGFCGDPIGG